MRKVPLNSIKIGKFKVRVSADAYLMAQLRDSIRKHGDVINPIPVRQLPDGTYEALGGHRRLQAAKEAGLTEVTVRVFEVTDVKDSWRICWHEDVLKEPWSPIDKARAIQRMREDGLNVTDIALITGLSTSGIEDLLDLLKLPEKVQEMVSKAELPPSHARELLGLKPEEAIEIASKASSEKWTREKVAEEAKQKKPKFELILPKEERITTFPGRVEKPTISPKEAKIEEIPAKPVEKPEAIEVKPAKPAELEVKKEPLEYFYVDCPICKQVFEIVHLSDGSHKFKEVKGRL